MTEPQRAALRTWQQFIDAAMPAAAAAAPTADVTLEQLRAVMPNLPLDKAERYLPLLNQAMAEFEITTPQRKAMFVAQLAHESAQLTQFEEGGKPDYSGKLGPGNENYYGRGPIQLTGRANYEAAGKALGIDLVGHPELAAKPEHGFRIAGWFWDSRNLNKYADEGDYREVTRRINGGYTHYDRRVVLYDRAKKAFGVP
jgi:putative chitinase